MINRNAAGEAVSKTEFVYDGLSRLRVSKEFTRQKVGWVAVAEKRRVYDGMNVVQERDGANERLAFYTRGLDMGGGIGGLLARSGDGVNLFYHYDGRGNVGQLTNAGGELAARYTYDAFGVLIGSSGAAASLNAYRFSTKEAIGALVYYGFRFYSPSLGKWINRDPIQEAGGTNAYLFVLNDPIGLIDILGLWPKKGDADYDPYFHPYRGGPPPTRSWPTPPPPPSRFEPPYGDWENFIPFNPGGESNITILGQTFFGPGHFNWYTTEERCAVWFHERYHRTRQGQWLIVTNPDRAEYEAWIATIDFINTRLADPTLTFDERMNFGAARSNANIMINDYGGRLVNKPNLFEFHRMCSKPY